MSRQGQSSRSRAGFAWVELVTVVAIGVVLASLSIPRIVSAGSHSWEDDAISTLRSLVSAQVQLQSIVAIDTDNDGVGEFGAFGELSGASPLRVASGGNFPEPGIPGIDELDPPLIHRSLGRVNASSTVRCRGYVYKIFLPGPGFAPIGISEEAFGGFAAAPFPDPQNGASFWCAYAWPYKQGPTSRRAFFVNEVGTVLACPNRGAHGAPVYFGIDPTHHPVFDAAYLGHHMASGAAIDGMGRDGNRWREVE